MIHRILFASFLLITSLGFSQEVVEWSYSYNKEESTIAIDAKIEDGWHLYSQKINEGIGPVPTSFLFENSNAIKRIGEVKEPEPITEHDNNFGGELSYFKHDVTFNQKIKVRESTKLEVTITYMVCNDEMCLPPTDKIITLSTDK